MRTTDQHGERGGRYRAALAVLVAVLAVGGLVAVFGFIAAQPGPPSQPPVAAQARTGPPTDTSSTPSSGPSLAEPSNPTPAPASSSRAPTPRTVGPSLPRSLPVELNITSIGVHSALMTLGTNADGSVQVPPLGGGAPAGWYRGSPTPGQLGPAVVLGHVHDHAGPAVFYELGGLKPGARVSVTRADHRVAVFRVDRVDSYAKDRFPTAEVYGNTDRAELRLITCGSWNSATGQYERNIVVSATLVSAHPA
jgi:sortase (surface protein transpeptidase)